MSDVYGAGIDQAKLFQTISLAVADTTKEVLEGEQANRIRELEAENTRIVAEAKQCHEQNDRLVSERMLLRQSIRELEVEVARLQGLVRNYKETIEGNELDIEGLLEKLRAVVSDCAGCFRTAAEDIQDWGDYADAYFQKKHGLKSDVERYRNKADELEALLK